MRAPDLLLRVELGRFKTSVDYARFRHQERQAQSISE